jgi:amino acid permease
MASVQNRALRAVAGNFFVVRILLVAVTAGVAFAVRNFGAFLSLIGYAGYGFQGFVQPAWFYLVVFRETLTSREIAACTALCIIGVASIIGGSTVSIMEMVQ